MSDKDEDIKTVKSFIFNDNLMDFNILEITGMGNQEIKHSNILKKYIKRSKKCNKPYN